MGCYGSGLGAMALCAVVLFGCGDDETSLKRTTEPPEVLPRECPQGWAALEDGTACDAVLPEESCAPGTLPKLGGRCDPVGPSSCPAGFTPNPSGWGCLDVIPEAVCEGATFEVLGETSCQPVGDCAAPFPPADATLFVDASFAPGDLDASHFLTVTDAVLAASAGAVIAIESGVYIEQLRVDTALSLVGRCAAEVTLMAPANAPDPGIDARTTGVFVQGLTLTGHFNGIVATSSAEIEIAHAVVDGNRTTGVLANGGSTVSIHDSVVRDGFDDGGTFGYGVFAQEAATVALSRTSVSRNSRGGIVAFDAGTVVTTEDVVIRDTQPRSNGNDGNGMVLTVGARGELTRSALVANGQAALIVEGPDDNLTTAVVRDSVIRDTQPHPTGLSPPGVDYTEFFGWSASVQGLAELDVEGSSFVRSGGASLVCAIAPAKARVVDSVIFETLLFPDGAGTSGIGVQADGQLELVRSAIVGASSVGVQLLGGHVTFEDSLIADTERGPNRTGHALQMGGLSTATADGSAFIRNAGSGFLMADQGTGPPGAAAFRGGIIADNPGYADGTFGRAVDIGGGAVLELSGSAVSDDRQVAVLVSDPGTVARLSGCVIRDTRSDGAGNAGRAVNVQNGARVEISGTLIRDSRDVGLLVGQAGSTGLAEDSVILRTHARESDGRFGLGALSIQGAHLDLLGVRIAESAGIGFAVAAASATVSGCTLTNNPVALQVQDGSTLREADALTGDVGPLDVVITSDTRFIDNETRLGASAVPLPDVFAE